ncbi:unnamed protein product [Phytomonas sp. EM1]|nr:unnamed protein product [Phytomonas sp. EM1]|eukprot:CCW63415.1 unnamed protein product [Phytomonas sp. isolate EM1]
MDSQPFRLLEILQEKNDVDNGSVAPVSPEGSPSIVSPTFVVLEVGPEALRYRCPVYLLEIGSSSIQKLLAYQHNQTEKRPDSRMEANADTKVSDNNAGLEEELTAQEVVEDSFLSASNTNIPLPDIGNVCFETVALYLEHFYGVASSSRPGRYGNQLSQVNPTNPPGYDPAEAGQDRPPGEALFSHERPTPLAPPMKLQDLYGLAGWEREFVLERLVRWRESRMAARGPAGILAPAVDAGSPAWASGGTAPDSGLNPTMEDILYHDGAWVDALGTPSCRSSPTERLQVVEPCLEADWIEGPSEMTEPAPRITGPKVYPSYVVSFTLEEKQSIMNRLCETLHAAGRLGVVPLQHLCAALIANMVARLNEENARLVVARPVDGNLQSIPPMSANRRTELLKRHPWLEAILKEKKSVEGAWAEFS